MANQLRGRKYSGDLFARKYGTDDPFRKIGNLTELTTNRESETDTLPSTGKHDYGAALETVATPGPTTITGAFNTFDKDTFGMILMGEVSDLTNAVTTQTDAPIKAHFDSWGKLPHGDIDPATVVVQTTGGSPVTLDAAHYVINKTVGMVILRESAKTEYGLAEGDDLTVTYSTAGTAGVQIDINTLDSYELEMYLDGKDRITQKPGVLEMPHAVLAAKDGVNWMADEWWTSGVEGTLIKPDDKPAARFKEYEI
ncbi:MAG: hypothetical protein CR975_01210 [Gammaproteobacteria bacterium]|nr:MAG: hypothetical protein CR975_01210 [Gammaproteobacteria bacterium]